MDSKEIVSRRQLAELRARVTDAEQPNQSAPDFELTEEQKAELKTKRRNASSRVDELVWAEKGRVLDGRVLPHRKKKAVEGYSYLPTGRTLDYSDWIVIDRPDEHTQVEVRLGVHSDITSFTGESGYQHVLGEQPVSTISIRLNNPQLDAATKPEELFTFRWGDAVAFRGEAVDLDSPRWEDLDQLLADIEKHFELPHQTAEAALKKYQ